MVESLRKELEDLLAQYRCLFYLSIDFFFHQGFFEGAALNQVWVFFRHFAELQESKRQKVQEDATRVEEEDQKLKVIKHFNVPVNVFQSM